MNFKKKLPLGLALATCIIMASCSKDDFKTPQPGTDITGTGFSNERNGLTIPPKISTTDGPAGNNTFAPDWEKKVDGLNNDHLLLRPAGTSTKTHLWGDQNFPWVKALPNPPGSVLGANNNIATIIYQNGVLCDDFTDSKVKTTIYNLKPGKKYALTVSMASSVCVQNGQSTQYAKAAQVKISQGTNVLNSIFDLTGKNAEWVTQTVIFEATNSNVTVDLRKWVDGPFEPSNEPFFYYIHGFIGKNALVELL